MTTVTPHRGRSVWAVIAGFIVTAALSLLTDVVMHAAGVLPPWGQPMAEPLFVLATAYRLAFTVLGGFVTAALAPGRPMRHVIVLGSVGTVAALAGLIATWNAGPALGPRWYPIALVVTAIPCVWAGGALCVRRRRLAAVAM